MKKGREGYSIDPKTGQREDETVHGPILEGLSAPKQKQQRRAAKERVRAKHGFDEETLNLLYGHE